MVRLALLVLLALGPGVVPESAAAQDATTRNAEAVGYVLRFPAPQTHYVEVEATYPTGGRAEVELMMAVWTPGSYLVREYARHVENLHATSPGGVPLAVEKSRKNRWRITTAGNAKVVVRYRVYCREMSVRTNWVEESYGVLNGAPTFITLADDAGPRPHDVSLELPAEWKRSETGLPPHPGGAEHYYRAPDFDTLVDCPIIVGNPAVYEFEVGGKKHYLVNQGEGGIWDGPRSAEDVAKIVRTQTEFWGSIPYESYYFLNVICESGGGLEHKNSTLMMTSRWRSRVPKDYRRWLGLVSHEYFHTWNVKRLRPVELGPFDYEAENYTKSLWIAEGITSYYDDLLLHRAGLMKRKDYLEALSRNIDSLQTTPGRLVHPLESTSFDAWVKYYRRDENSSNTTISYYTKGAVVSFLLDAHIRKGTDGRVTLDDVLREAYRRYSGERGFTPKQFREISMEVSGLDLDTWFIAALETTADLDYQEALDWYGLRFKDPDAKKPKKDGDEADDEDDGDGDDDQDDDESEKRKKAWIGLRSRADGGRIVVTQVRRETPAHAAGLNVDDEIIALDGFRVRSGGWERRLEQYQPGDAAVLLIARRDELMRKTIVFAEQPKKRWQLQVRKDASDVQKQRLEAWLTGK